MIGRQTIYYQPGTVFRPVASMDFHQTRCEDKPSLACEHAVPSSRAELLIRTIAETNMALCGPLAGQVNYDKRHGLV